MKRRTALQLLGAGVAALGFRRSLWGRAGDRENEFFIFIHAGGGWDVTLWADPRNETKGLVNPASTVNTDISGLKLWRNTPLDGNGQTFEILTPANSALRLGPAIGDLYELHDRLTIINGIAMNTVSHDDGVVYSMTGRHRAGGTVPQSSIDVLVAHELGTKQLMPDVSIRFSSYFVGDHLDRHAIPLRVSSVDEITKSFARSDSYLDRSDRDAITALLASEAHQLGKQSIYPETFEQLASQQEALPKLLADDFTRAFATRQLQASYPQFDYAAHTQGSSALGAAFAVEAIKRNLVRCVSFSLGGLDTHGLNYRQHAHTLQELFGTIGALVKLLDATPHPTLNSTKLSEHTHILVLSDFCRTPQINLNGGRDHYPNNSALVISPRFRGGRTFGGTDLEQLLPVDAGTFTDGKRPVTPPDVLATFLGAFGIDPRHHMRDGEIVKELLA